MDKPFTPILLSIIAGIIFSDYIQVNSFILLGLMITTLFFSILLLYKNKSNFYSYLILFFLIGSLNVSINRNSQLENYIDKRHDYIGIVHEIEEVEDGISKYIIKINSVDNSAINEKIVLNVLGVKELSLGDTIFFNGILKSPLTNTNPKLFNYKLHLLTEKIYTTMTIKDYSINKIKDNENYLYVLKNKFSNDVINLFNKYLTDKNSNFLTGIILGKSKFIDEEELLKFRELGLAHLLAVSGLHIGIIAGFLIYLLSHLGINRRINIILTICTIWAYGIIIGAPASAMRACLMFTILFYSQIIHEPYDVINSIVASMVISLIINPYWIYNIGFQLSYVATISIVSFTPKIKSIFYPLKSNIISAISTILAVNIGLLPIQSYYFNEIQLIGIISNIVAIPLLTISLIIGAMMVIFNYFLSFLNIVLGNLLELFLTILRKIMEFLFLLPASSIKIFSPDITYILLYYLALCIVFNQIDINKFGKGAKKSIFYYLVILVLVNAIYINIDDRIEIDFIDVGQGDSILIKTQDSTILMDTGGSIFEGYDIGKYITLPYLQKHGIYNLDAVLITHFDADHYQGIYQLFNEIRIDKIYAGHKPDDIQFNYHLQDKKIPLVLLKANDILKLDRNTTMEILWPEENTNLKTLSENNKSLVAKLKYKDFDILFTGDIESEVERSLLNNSIKDIEIYKVPHHGSNTSSTEPFLKEIKPQNSIISAGRNNIYGHPHKDVLQRLSDANSNIYRTDTMGLIRATFEDDSYNISSYLKQRDLFSMLIENIAILAIIVLYFLISYILMRQYAIEREGD